MGAPFIQALPAQLEKPRLRIRDIFATHHFNGIVGAAGYTDAASNAPFEIHSGYIFGNLHCVNGAGLHTESAPVTAVHIRFPYELASHQEITWNSAAFVIPQTPAAARATIAAVFDLSIHNIVRKMDTTRLFRRPVERQRLVG